MAADLSEHIWSFEEIATMANGYAPTPGEAWSLHEERELNMKEQHSTHQTQWAAQFGVASELCKRGYLVALTVGNHPAVDLMVMSPEGKPFSIDVKGLYKKNFWVIKQKPELANLYYVLAFVPRDAPARFFILNQAEVNAKIPQHLDRIRANRMKKGLSVEKVGVITGLPWEFTEHFENQWKKLPE